MRVTARSGKTNARGGGTTTAEARRAQPGYDYALLLGVVGLVVIGLLMTYSATFDWAVQDMGSRFAKFRWQLLWVAIGAALLVAFARVPYNWWQRVAVQIFIATLALLAGVLLIGAGRGAQGAEVFRRGFLGGSIQPSEAAKLGLVIYMAAWISSKGERIRDVTYGLVPFAVLIGVLAGLLVLQPDLSAALLAITVAVAMFFVGGADIFQMALASAVGGVTLYLLISSSDYATQRISDWVLLWNNPTALGDRGWHNLQALMALGSGGIFGMGLGQGVQKTGYLPAPHTDSIFAVIGQETGLLGCLVVLALLVLITYRGFRIALESTEGFASLLAFGLTTWTAVQALLNVGVVTGLVPFTGVALPFISFGGSATVTSLAGVGLLLSISRGNRVGRRVERAERTERPERQQANLDRRWWNGGTRVSRPRRRAHVGRR